MARKNHYKQMAPSVKYAGLTDYKICDVPTRNELSIELQRRIGLLLDERDELKERERRRLKKRPPLPGKV